MRTSRKPIGQGCRGVVLIISMVFVVIFAALAITMATFSGVNVQLADNQHKANRAFSTAESGLDILQFWLARVVIPGTTPESERFDRIALYLQNDLADNGITNIAANYDGLNTITVPSVFVDSANAQSFDAVLQEVTNDLLQLQVTGFNGQITRTIGVNYDLGPRAHNVFDYGVATKGPLHMEGSTEVGGNVDVESVYIEAEDSNIALSITGNSHLAGNVSITNTSPAADIVYLEGEQASIGGETEPNAIDHVSTAVGASEFPTPNPAYFEPYIGVGAEHIIDSNTDTSADAVYENVRIMPDTNPTFSGSVTLRGIVFIEVPNVVTFAGSVDITGIIVGNGDPNDDSGTNRIEFSGNVTSAPVSDLPADDPLHDETGTFLMAPGFNAFFTGSFSTLNGAIAANGITFSGNADATIEGSVINYSDTPMEIIGNSNLIFNSSGAGQTPAGFITEIILKYVSTSYSELVL